MPFHTVAQGECLSSIAAGFGHVWQTIWLDASNAGLRASRKDPNVLLPGDQIFIPDLRERVESGATDQTHEFVLKCAKTTIRIRLLDQDLPRSGVSYILQIDGVSTHGKTDGGGYLTEKIPPGAQTGKLIVGTGAAKDVYQLQLGNLDPLDADSGVIGRLGNLGFIADDLAAAIKAFQKKEGLEVTGAADQATRNRLKERFGQ